MKKILILTLIIIFLSALGALAVNYSGNSKQAAVGRAGITGLPNSKFIAETAANSNRIEFMFTPKNRDNLDCRITYQLKEDGRTIKQAESELKTAINKDNPIFLLVARKSQSEYLLDMEITGLAPEGRVLHKDKIVIHPQEIKIKQ